MFMYMTLKLTWCTRRGSEPLCNMRGVGDDHLGSAVGGVADITSLIVD
jgi:hypothetical protein